MSFAYRFPLTTSLDFRLHYDEATDCPQSVSVGYATSKVIILRVGVHRIQNVQVRQDPDSNVQNPAGLRSGRDPETLDLPDPDS